MGIGFTGDQDGLFRCDVPGRLVRAVSDAECSEVAGMQLQKTANDLYLPKETP